MTPLHLNILVASVKSIVSSYLGGIWRHHCNFISNRLFRRSLQLSILGHVLKQLSMFCLEAAFKDTFAIYHQVGLLSDHCNFCLEDLKQLCISNSEFKVTSLLTPLKDMMEAAFVNTIAIKPQISFLHHLCNQTSNRNFRGSLQVSHHVGILTHLCKC